MPCRSMQFAVEDIQAAAEFSNPSTSSPRGRTVSSTLRFHLTWLQTLNKRSQKQCGYTSGLTGTNLMIKIPATPAGIPAIQQVIQ